MQRHLVRDGLRFKLAQRYQENPRHFLSLSKQAVDSALAREIVAELRNEGHVEEEVRGTIRLIPLQSVSKRSTTLLLQKLNDGEGLLRPDV
jgi:hypothetical protein